VPGKACPRASTRADDPAHPWGFKVFRAELSGFFHTEWPFLHPTGAIEPADSSSTGSVRFLYMVPVPIGTKGPVMSFAVRVFSLGVNDLLLGQPAFGFTGTTAQSVHWCRIYRCRVYSVLGLAKPQPQPAIPNRPLPERRARAQQHSDRAGQRRESVARRWACGSAIVSREPSFAPSVSIPRMFGRRIPSSATCQREAGGHFQVFHKIAESPKNTDGVLRGCGATAGGIRLQDSRAEKRARHPQDRCSRHPDGDTFPGARIFFTS
jgi:hypothetical protein